MTKEKINLHTHTSFCDGKNTVEEMVLSAINSGFTVLGFSSHCFYPMDPKFYLPFDSLWHIPADQVKAYAAEVKRLAQKYSGQIKIQLGFEADFFESSVYGSAIPTKESYAVFEPDYLIGAVHFVNTDKGFYTVDHKTEFVKENLIKLYSKDDGSIDGKKAVCDYFEAERALLQKGNFEILAHPDLIRKRNGDLHFFDEEESWYKEQLKLTAKAVAKAGVIAEINTGAMARGSMNDVYPSAQFLEYLKELGVPVCISSDCHEADKLDFAFDFAADRAKKAGYDELSYPVQGKIIHIKI